ncbi:hypothetical protein H0E87_011513 [Populus deltoides]|uniref:Uncharacterized protein n=1 Tax=Populus deltoides TaxID=3696 RepID=A0A8T2YXB2_POPDE|nr:hypothetical protein H0E87_011513 [Populus deltoides]
MDVEEKNAPFRRFVNPPSGCSAAHGIAKGLPPYTSNKLGDSFLRVSQLESLLRGTRGLQVVHKFFLLKSTCGHRRYSAIHEILKGIVLIENPDTSYMRKEDLERFKYLSGMDSLKIDNKEMPML